MRVLINKSDEQWHAIKHHDENYATEYIAIKDNIKCYGIGHLEKIKYAHHPKIYYARN